MTLVAVTQRVIVDPAHGERRDALDQRWATFLDRCDLVAVPIPNDAAVALRILEKLPFAGVLLTGGNDLCAVGGDAPERDATEAALLACALHRHIPVVGVCRGMQVIQQHAGVPLHRIDGHVTHDHAVDLGSETDHVNSYHRYGSATTAEGLDVWARASDGVVEAVRRRDAPVVGVMWHPERFSEPRVRDIELFREAFLTAGSR